MSNVEQIEPWLKNAREQRQSELQVDSTDPLLGQNNRRLIGEIFPNVEADQLSDQVDPLWEAYSEAANTQQEEIEDPETQILILKNRLRAALKAEKIAEDFPTNASAIDYRFVTVIKESVVHLIAQIYQEIRQLQEETTGSHQRLAELKKEALDLNEAERQPYRQAA